MFVLAKPIFPKEKSREKNTFAAFSAKVNSIKGCTLHITASSFYQVYINGRFVAFGPARSAKGYARVDLLPIGDYNSESGNDIVILVSGYYCGSLSTAISPSFVWAEVRDGDGVVCATGRDFLAYLPETRVREVMRYSLQRHFSEVYRIEDEHGMLSLGEAVEYEVLDTPPMLLPRRAPYASYNDMELCEAVSVGSLIFDAERPFLNSKYSGEITETWGKFDDEKIKWHPYPFIMRHKQIKRRGATGIGFTLSKMEYAIFDLGRVETGFIKALFDTVQDSDVIIAFSEDASADEFCFTNISAYNAIEIIAKAGLKVDFTSFEPYVMKYCIVAVVSGEITLGGFGIKGFEHSSEGMLLSEPSDPVLAAIFRGAVRTFNHNAVDIYMDCPSRERAGWLCDSYFTAKSEYALYGVTDIEDAFLENYRLYRNEGDIPKGALPMCYPSDIQKQDSFIPQWTMWYILEVEDYVNNRCHNGDKELFRDSINALLEFYRTNENEDGLLENIPGWNFVEWSRANSWCRNVNYPTNFLYAAALEAVYRLYGDESLMARAEEVRRVAILQSFDGVRFYDHAKRNADGVLELQSDCSEIAQYYAILFGGFDIDSEKYSRLRELVTKICLESNPDYPSDMEHINAFIGVYLRLEALIKMKEYSLALSELRSFFGEMERVTGTLWEFRERYGSRDHGFASYAMVVIDRALKEQ